MKKTNIVWQTATIIVLSITIIIVNRKIIRIEKHQDVYNKTTVMPDTIATQNPQDKPMSPLQQMKGLKLGE